MSRIKKRVFTIIIVAVLSLVSYGSYFCADGITAESDYGSYESGYGSDSCADAYEGNLANILTADFNLDGKVDTDDYFIFSDNFYISGKKTYFEGDTDGDGDVDTDDYFTLSDNWYKDYHQPGEDTFIYDSDGNLVLIIYADNHRDIYTYPDKQKPDTLFTTRELLDTHILNEGDVIKEYDSDGHLIRAMRCGAGVTIIVPDDYLTIQEAIDNAWAGDTVLVKKDLSPYREDIFMKDGVDLVGMELQEITVIGRITSSSYATLRNVTVEDCAYMPIVAIRSETSHFTIDRCVIINDCTACEDVVGLPLGIFMYPEASDITIRNTIVRVSNHKRFSMGICMIDASSVVIENNTVHVDVTQDAEQREFSTCIYSEDSDYVLRNNIITINDSSLNAVNANADTPEIAYNCILGRLSPITLAHKGTLPTSPSYEDAVSGDFHLAMAHDRERRSPSIALDSGDPASDFSNEIQLIAANKAIDLGAYGNTRYTVLTAKAGDADLDKDVDLDDLSILDANWDPTARNKTWMEGDFDGDGDVDLDDLSLLDANWAPAGYDRD